MNMHEYLLNRINERYKWTIEYASDFETLGMPTKNGIHLFFKKQKGMNQIMKAELVFNWKKICMQNPSVCLDTKKFWNRKEAYCANKCFLSYMNGKNSSIEGYIFRQFIKLIIGNEPTPENIGKRNVGKTFVLK